MQALQERLLKLLKEIDAICRDNAITYYCSGGTVIGAARHEGFIPWDDDIDICMMRDDFERFREVFRSSPPEGRFLLCSEDYPDYHSTIPRYAEADSTSFCRYHLLGEVPAGVSLDIFILEPVPNDPEAQRDFIRRFFLYSDFVMPFYCFSHRVPEGYLDELAGYIKKRDEAGESAVIEELREKLFPGTTEDSDYVCLLWASSPSIFPKAMYGEPARLRFEDAEICVPQDWYLYLVLEYGMNWATVPYSEVHESHITINRLDKPYARCYDARNSLYSQEELETLFYERKLATIEYEKRHRRLVDARSKIKAESVLTSLRNRLIEQDLDLKALYDSGELGTVLDFFAPFLEVQLSRWFIGSRTRFHYYHYLYPTVIDIADDQLEILLKTLLRKERFADLKKLLDTYTKAGRYAETAEYAKAVLSYVQNAERQYYYGCFEECIRLCDKCGFDEIAGYLDKLRWLCKAEMTPEETVDYLESAKAAVSRDVFYEKALGDAYFNSGSKEKALAVYSHILDTSRNGMFWKDIYHRTGMKTDAAESSAPYSPGRLLTLEKTLLDELVKLCSEHGISYVLSESLAARLVSEGGLGYKTDRKIVYMTLENARRFVSVCEDSLPADRVLLNRRNSDYISDFVLEYSVKDSVSVNLRDIHGTAGRGIGITIRILRSGSSYSPSNS